MSPILGRFHGGLHLPGHKQESTRTGIAQAPLPKRLVLPLQQHIGEPAEALVEVGERVLKGQPIARACGYVSVPLHAPSSGTVVDISDYPVPHPSGLSARCIVIDTDGKDRWIELPPPEDYRQMDPSALRNRVREAGIVGLGGAGFPSFIKLNPGARKAVDVLIINAAECEPYITCDDALMRERALDVVRGVHIMRHALQARECIIGIEDNKPQAFDALETALAHEADASVRLIRIPTLYPTGGEKQLIKVLTGKEVPSNGLPLELSVVCHNVGTAAAVYQALQHSRPLLSRIVTVTGGGVRNPRNLEVLVGTPIRELIAACGGRAADAGRIILGGPMMGFELQGDDPPVTKTANCILIPTPEELPASPAPLACIRCGACVEVCPANLLPQQLYWHSRAKEFDKVQDYHVFDCIECGCCAYVCPSHIPLVQYYRFAKTEIWAQERDKRKSDQARRRHEFRLERLERDKAEREERMRRKKAALQESAGKDDVKKAAIAAALKRVKDKQQQKAAARPASEQADGEER